MARQGTVVAILSYHKLYITPYQMSILGPVSRRFFIFDIAIFCPDMVYYVILIKIPSCKKGAFPI